MNYEERIAELEARADKAMDGMPIYDGRIAIACELRALRLMLREEIREAAWRLADPGQPIASRKAPDA